MINKLRNHIEKIYRLETDRRFISSSNVFVYGSVLFQLFLAARAANYSYLCQPVDYSDDPNEVRVSTVSFMRRALMNRDYTRS